MLARQGVAAAAIVIGIAGAAARISSDAAWYRLERIANARTLRAAEPHPGAGEAPAAAMGKKRRMILVSLDGLSAPILEDAVARGVMPHLARIKARGASARGSITALPGKTAAGHAALFTGTGASRNGISGNEVPVMAGAVLDSVSGYTSAPLTAEPIWAAAARQGLFATVLSATQVYPFTPYMEGQRYGANGAASRQLLLDGYQSTGVAEEIVTAKDLQMTPAAGWRGRLPPHVGAARDFEFVLGGVHAGALVYDDPHDVVKGFDTIYISVGKSAHGGITLKPQGVREDAGAFQILSVKTESGELGVPFRLFVLSPSGDRILLYRAGSRVMRANGPPIEKTVLKATGGFTGNGASGLYERGRFGPVLWEGGDGTAERRYLETVRLVAGRFQRLNEFGVTQTKWDLVITYLPFPDEMLHIWFGYLDPSLPGHDPALAARLRPFMDAGLRIVDEYVGHLASLGGPESMLAVAADHGFLSSDREVRINVGLRDAGLLALDSQGRIDIPRSRAVYFPGNAGYVLLNRVSRPQGVVLAEQEQGVLAELRGVLEGLRDPETGERVVSEILSAGKVEALGGGGESGGDLYFTLAPRYYPSSQTRGDLVSRTVPRGVHMMDPLRREMHASFVVAGSGIPRGVDLGVIRQIDIAPTLCALLGVAPPSTATRAVLEPVVVGGTSEATVESR